MLRRNGGEEGFGRELPLEEYFANEDWWFRVGSGRVWMRGCRVVKGVGEGVDWRGSVCVSAG